MLMIGRLRKKESFRHGLDLISLAVDEQKVHPWPSQSTSEAPFSHL